MTKFQTIQPWRYLVFVLFLITGSALSILSDSLLTDTASVVEEKNPLFPEFLTGGWVRPVMVFVAMVVGMFFNQLFENLKEQKEAGRTTVNIFQTFALGWKGLSFWMALLVSPIIFYGTYYIGDSLPDGKVAYFFAFQNGFFWYNIFHKFELKSKSGK